MPIAGVIAEVVLAMVLLVIVLKFFSGWKPRLSLRFSANRNIFVTLKSLAMFSLAVIERLFSSWRPKLSLGKVMLAGIMLVYANIAVLHLLQETSDGHYGFLALALMPTILWVAASCNSEVPALSKLVAVGSAIWIAVLMEAGLMFNSYAAILSATVVLVLAFQCWRDPKEEGFVKTSRYEWVHAGAIFLLIGVVATAGMIGFGWDHLMISRYPLKFRWVPLLSVVPFFLVKAIPEELIFRGIFQGALKDRFGFFPALIGATVLYGVAALNNPAPWAFPNWHAAVNALLLGLGCGYIYNESRSLVVSGSLNAAVSFVWYFTLAQGGH